MSASSFHTTFPENYGDVQVGHLQRRDLLAAGSQRPEGDSDPRDLASPARGGNARGPAPHRLLRRRQLRARRRAQALPRRGHLRAQVRRTRRSSSVDTTDQTSVTKTQVDGEGWSSWVTPKFDQGLSRACCATTTSSRTTTTTPIATGRLPASPTGCRTRATSRRRSCWITSRSTTKDFDACAAAAEACGRCTRSSTSESVHSVEHCMSLVRFDSTLAQLAVPPRRPWRPSPCAAAQNMQINGAGATFPYPIYSKWFSEYNKLQAERARSTTSRSARAAASGRSRNQTVFFGATDGPMTPGPAAGRARQASCTSRRCSARSCRSTTSRAWTPS